MKRKVLTIMIIGALASCMVTACGKTEKTNLSTEEKEQILTEILEKEDEVRKEAEVPSDDDGMDTIKDASKKAHDLADEADKQAEDIKEQADKLKDDMVNDISGEMDLSGSWQDEVSKRATMDVKKNSDGSYDIVIHWGASATEAAIWEIHGTYDAASGMLYYENGKYGIYTFDENGGETVSEETTTKGSLMKEGDKLRWQDSKNSEDGLFVKE